MPRTVMRKPSGQPKSLALSLREYWVFAMQTGILSKSSFSSEAISAAASALEIDVFRAVHFLGDGADFVFDAQLDIVGKAEFIGLVVDGVDDFARQIRAARAAFAPHFGQGKLRRRVRRRLFQSLPTRHRSRTRSG